MRIKWFVLVVVFAGMSIAQDWSWVNPLPQGNTLNDVKKLGNGIVYAVGDNGTILKSLDDGLTWNKQKSGVTSV